MKYCQQNLQTRLCGRPAVHRVKKTNGRYKNICQACFERWAEAQFRKSIDDLGSVFKKL